MPGCSLSECAMCRSDPQMPQASTRRTRSPGRGAGSGICSTASHGSAGVDTAARTTASGRRRGRWTELQVQLGHAAQDEGGDVAVAARSGGSVVLLRDADLAQPIEQALDTHPSLRAGQLAAHAGVDAAAERQVLARVLAVDLELVRVLEPLGVPACGAVEQHQRRTGWYVDTAELRRDAGQPEVALHRALDP